MFEILGRWRWAVRGRHVRWRRALQPNYRTTPQPLVSVVNVVLWIAPMGVSVANMGLIH